MRLPSEHVHRQLCGVRGSEGFAEDHRVRMVRARRLGRVPLRSLGTQLYISLVVPVSISAEILLLTPHYSRFLPIIRISCIFDYFPLRIRNSKHLSQQPGLVLPPRGAGRNRRKSTFLGLSSFPRATANCTRSSIWHCWDISGRCNPGL